MIADSSTIFSALKSVLVKHAKRLSVKTDTPTEYALVAKIPSPLPQHKGHPLEVASVRVSKAYVSFHLMPLAEVAKNISPELKKRMQGKTCFNFKTAPDQELLSELERVAEAGIKQWSEKKWL
jgi:hypothetical protein